MLSEMGSLIERNGGVPYPAPVLQEVHLGDTPEVIELVDLVRSLQEGGGGHHGHHVAQLMGAAFEQ